jgi:hypothetical protein
MQKFLMLVVSCVISVWASAQPALHEKAAYERFPVEFIATGDSVLLKSGTSIIVEVGTTFLQLDENAGCIKMNFIFGYRLNEHLLIGLGAGLRYNTLSKDMFTYNGAPSPIFNDFGIEPFFIDFRFNFQLKRLKPFILLDWGYSFDMEENDPTSRQEKYSMKNIRPVGSLFCPGAGLNFFFSEKYIVSLAVSYELQKHQVYLGWTHGNPSGETANSGSLNLTLGLSF